MNQATDNKGKEGVLKTLAIGGFVGLIIIIAWLGIQLISFMPTAFSSLASLADSVYNYKPAELVVVNNKDAANAGEAFTISWNEVKQDGKFSFKYACMEGVAVEIRTAGNPIKSVDCDKYVDLGKVTSMDINITSEKNRFAEVAYTVAFTPIKAKTPSVEHGNSITVVNPMISPEVIVSATTTEPVVTEPEPAVETKPETTPTKPTPKPVTPKPVTVSTPIYSIPVSNPNGFTDLSVRSIGVGTMDASNRFTLVGVMDNDAKGAIQFEIKNIGTKTSGEFTYTATLPSGAVYTSPAQPALKPNERSIITLGFETANQTGVKTFNVKVAISGDINSANNSYVSAVKIND